MDMEKEMDKEAQIPGRGFNDLVRQTREKFSVFDLDGNNVALDFVNTVEYRDTPKAFEWITSYIDALGWAERVGILSPEAAEQLIARGYERDSSDWYRQIIDYRKILYQVFSSAVKQEKDKPAVLDDLNVILQATRMRAVIEVNKSGFSWRFPDVEEDPTGFLQPVVNSAANLLVDSDILRLKLCSSPECGWLFYDTSKNRSRRWCSMKGCGNRAKVNQFYRNHLMKN